MQPKAQQPVQRLPGQLPMIPQAPAVSPLGLAGQQGMLSGLLGRLTGERASALDQGAVSLGTLGAPPSAAASQAPKAPPAASKAPPADRRVDELSSVARERGLTTEEMIRELQQRIRNLHRGITDKFGRIPTLQNRSFDPNIDSGRRGQIIAEIRDLRQAIARDERNNQDMESDLKRLQDERVSSAAAAAPPSVADTASEKSFKSVSDETAVSKDEAEALQERAKEAVEQSKVLVARASGDILQPGLKKIILETIRDLTKRGVNELSSRMLAHAEWIYGTTRS